MLKAALAEDVNSNIFGKVLITILGRKKLKKDLPRFLIPKIAHEYMDIYIGYRYQFTFESFGKTYAMLMDDKLGEI